MNSSSDQPSEMQGPIIFHTESDEEDENNISTDPAVSININANNKSGSPMGVSLDLTGLNKLCGILNAHQQSDPPIMANTINLEGLLGGLIKTGPNNEVHLHIHINKLQCNHESAASTSNLASDVENENSAFLQQQNNSASQTPNAQLEAEFNAISFPTPTLKSKQEGQNENIDAAPSKNDEKTVEEVTDGEDTFHISQVMTLEEFMKRAFNMDRRAQDSQNQSEFQVQPEESSEYEFMSYAEIKAFWAELAKDKAKKLAAAKCQGRKKKGRKTRKRKAKVPNWSLKSATRRSTSSEAALPLTEPESHLILMSEVSTANPKVENKSIEMDGLSLKNGGNYTTFGKIPMIKISRIVNLKNLNNPFPQTCSPADTNRNTALPIDPCNPLVKLEEFVEDPSQSQHSLTPEREREDSYNRFPSTYQNQNQGDDQSSSSLPGKATPLPKIAKQTARTVAAKSRGAIQTPKFTVYSRYSTKKEIAAKSHISKKKNDMAKSPRSRSHSQMEAATDKDESTKKVKADKKLEEVHHPKQIRRKVNSADTQNKNTAVGTLPTSPKSSLSQKQQQGCASEIEFVSGYTGRKVNFLKMKQNEILGKLDQEFARKQGKVPVVFLCSDLKTKTQTSSTSTTRPESDTQLKSKSGAKIGKRLQIQKKIKSSGVKSFNVEGTLKKRKRPTGTIKIEYYELYIESKNPNTQRNQWECKKCGVVFQLMATIQRKLGLHYKFHLDATRFTCNYCGMVFEDISSNVRHMKLSHGYKEKNQQKSGDCSTKKTKKVKYSNTMIAMSSSSESEIEMELETEDDESGAESETSLESKSQSE